MTRSFPTHKTATNRFLAVLLTALFATSMLPATSAASHPDFAATVDGVLDPATIVGDDLVVDLLLRLDVDASAPKATVAVEGGSSVQVPLRLTRTYADSATGDAPWTGSFVINPSSDAEHLATALSVSGNGPKNITVSFGDADLHTFAWTKGAAATLVRDTGTKIEPFAKGTITSFFEDRAVKVSVTDAVQGGSCPTGAGAYRLVYENQHGIQESTAVSCEKVTRSGVTALTLTAATAPGHVGDRERFKVHVLDPVGADGKASLATLEARWFETDAGRAIVFFDDDFETPVPGSGVSGFRTKLVVRLIDGDADQDPTTAETYGVTLRSLTSASDRVGTLTLNLKETGVHTGEFQGVFELSPVSEAGRLRVTSAVTQIEAAATDDHPSGSQSKTFSKIIGWSPSSDSFIRVLDQDQRKIIDSNADTDTNFIKHGESAVAFTGGPGQDGAFLEIRVEESDATPTILVVRNERARPGACNAAALDGALPSASNANCAIVQLSPLQGDTYRGFLGLFTAERYKDNLDVTLGTNAGRLLVSDGETLYVEVLDALTARGETKQIEAVPVTWRQAYDGQVAFDADNYFLSETATIEVFDPDRSGSSLTVTARTDDSSKVVTLEAVSGTNGLFSGSLTFGSGGLIASDGEQVTVEYLDPVDASGEDRRDVGNAPFTDTVRVWGTGSAVVSILAGNHLDGAPVQATLEDSNADTGAGPLAINGAGTYSHPDFQDEVYVSETEEDGVFEAEFLPDVLWTTKTGLEPDMTVGEDYGAAPDGEGACYFILDLGGPILPFAHVVSTSDDGEGDPVTWTQSSTPDPNGKVFRTDMARGLILIDDPTTQTQLCNQAAVQRDDVEGELFTVTYIPAPQVVERFISPVAVPAGSELHCQLQGPFFSDGSKECDLVADFPGQTIPFRPPVLDTSMNAQGDATIPWAGTGYVIPSDIDNDPANGGSDFIAAYTIDGTYGSAPDKKMLKTEAFDHTEMIIPIKAPAGGIRAGGVIEVVYYLNNMAKAGFTSGTLDLGTSGPLVPGSMRTPDHRFAFDPSPALGGHDVDQVLEYVTGDASVPIGEFVDEHGAVLSGSADVVYTTQVFRDGRIPYNERFVDDEGTLTVSYLDPDNAIGMTAADPVVADATYSIAKPGVIQTQTAEGDRTQFIFGLDQGARLVVSDAAGNTDGRLIDTAEVTVTARPETKDGLGSVIGTVDLTLQETDAASGRFTKILEFTTKTVNTDGKIPVGDHDVVRLSFDYSGRDTTETAWWYKVTPNQLSVSKDKVEGTVETTDVTVTDADAGTRVTDLRFVDIGGRYTDGTTPDANEQLFLPQDMVPVVPGSQVLMVCEAGSDVCETWKSVGAAPIPLPSADDAKEYGFDPATGRITVNLRSNSADGAQVEADQEIRVDFRIQRSSDAPVSVQVDAADGGFLAHGTLDLRETTASSGIFQEAVSFAPGTPGVDPGTNTITLGDGDTATFRAVDVNYFRTGDRIAADSTLTSDCIVTGTTTSCPMGLNTRLQSDAVTEWDQTETGSLELFPAGAGTACTDCDLFGGELYRLRITDADRNTDPSKSDAVQVNMVSPSGSSTVTLFETLADSGVFEVETRMTGLSGLSLSDGAEYDVVYTDPASATGSQTTIRLSQTAGSATWNEAQRGIVSVREDVLANGGTVRIQVIDVDRDDDPFARDALSLSDLDIAFASTRAAAIDPGEGTACSPASSTLLNETDVSSHIFEGTFDVSDLGCTVGSEGHLRIAYKDPQTDNGASTSGLVSREVVRIVPATTGYPVLSDRTFVTEDDLVTVTVSDTTPGAASPARHVDVYVGDLSGAPAESFALGTEGRVTFGLQSEDTDNIADVEVKEDEPFFVVYTDEQSKASGTDAPRTSVVRAILSSVADSIPSVAEIVDPTAPDGENGFYLSAPKVRLTLEDPGLQGAFREFRYSVGTALETKEDGTSCNLPCEFRVTEQGGPTVVYYRSVTLADQYEPVQELEVFFDNAAPTAVVSDLTATSEAQGAIALEWSSSVQKSDLTEFGEYRIYINDTTELVGNATDESFTHIPFEDGEHTYLVAVADAAGNIDTSTAVSVSGLSDRVAPSLVSAGVLQTEIIEGEDELLADLFAVMDTFPSDFDKVVAVVSPPAGGGDDIEVVLSGDTSSTPTNFTGRFTAFNTTGVYSFSFRALDAVGNFEPISDTVRFKGIDRTAPTATVPEVVERGSPLKVRLQDNDAGVATAEYAIDGGSFTDVALPSGTVLDHTFDVPTTALSLGSHTITIRAVDLSDEANELEQAFSFEVVAPGSLPGSGTGDTRPAIALPADLIESGRPLKVRVTAKTLTALTVAIDDGAAQPLLSSWSAATGIVDVPTGGLATGEHTATVVATNAEGTSSQEVSFFLLEAGVPAPPSSLTVTMDADGFPSLSWTPSTSSNVGGYLVHRSASPWKVVAVLGPDTTTYTDTNVDKDKVYKYKVTAFGTNGEGELAEGADSEESLAFFSRVQGSGDVTVGEPAGFFGKYWWVFLVLLAVAGAVVAVYVYRDRLFASKEEEEAYGAYPDQVEESPFEAPTHELRCPNCTHEFSVTGEKPVVTTCPNCGKKGILR